MISFRVLGFLIALCWIMAIAMAAAQEPICPAHMVAVAVDDGRQWPRIECHPDSHFDAKSCAPGYERLCDARDHGAHPYQPYGGSR